ncbi:MAG: multicopper oxidase domain-containing protein [Methanomicrobiales archaeon]|nr:multicopper oxidase domain-containing protein [Methanomicrobiales archaeon]
MTAKHKRYRPVWKGLELVVLGLLALLVLSFPVAAQNCEASPDGTIDPTTIPQFEYSLNTVFPPFGAPPVWVPTKSTGSRDTYVITASKFEQQLLPPVTGCFKKTTVFAYGGNAKFAASNTFLGFVQNSPAGTFETMKGKTVEVQWVNDLQGDSIVAVDPTLHWADPNQICAPPENGVCPDSKDPDNIMCELDSSGTLCMPMLACYPDCPEFPPGIALAQAPIPIVTHLHGGEDRSTSDGGPNQWFTRNGIHGPDYTTEKKTDANSAIYEYPNNQLATTLFYHDHALGMTRINVLSGLAGFYLIRQPNEPKLIADPKYEVPLAIQDRTFKADGDLWFPTVGNNPDVHPYWNPEFFGNTIIVNGLVWPKMDVDRTTYRLRFVDGSNARFYTMHFMDGNNEEVSFLQIGSDGGYLEKPVSLTEFTFAPGERVDLLIDFTDVTGPVTLTNTARFPFPDGDLPIAGLDGTIMRFDITGPEVASPPVSTATTLNTNLPDFADVAPAVTRNLVLREVMSAIDEPLEVLLNGQKWAGVLRETPAPGTIEEWRFIDTTGDTHPMHVHLVQFQVTGRQNFNPQYLDDWINKQYTDCASPPITPLVNLKPCGTLEPPADVSMRGPPWPIDYSPLDLDVSPYLTGTFRDPDANEQGWKDTVRSNPEEVTFIRIRFQRQDGTGHPPFWYSFDPTYGPGYVWHCHIIDHEDNEMMRPYKLMISKAPGPTKVNPPVPGPTK